ncbi:MAG: carboxypeptidase regulatory-like domain-containing protein, partial [Bacteroidota bacterium]
FTGVQQFEDLDITSPNTYYYSVSSVDSAFIEGARSGSVEVTVNLGPPGPRGIIAGLVKDDSTGAPLASVQVRLFRQGDSTSFVYSLITDSLGQFWAKVDTGVYRVYAERLWWFSSGAQYRPEWYDDAERPGDATPIELAADDSAWIPVGLERESAGLTAHISGTVRDGQGSPLSLALVAIIRTIQDIHQHSAVSGIPAGLGGEEFDFAGFGYLRGVMGFGLTDSLGQYDVEVPDSAGYLAIAWRLGYLPEFAGDKHDPAEADIIYVTGDTSGVDFSLTEVGGSASTVKGSVRSEGGGVVAGRVMLFPRPNGGPTKTGQFVFTDDQGDFEIQNVEAGTYYVQAVPYSGYGPAYYKSGAHGIDRWEDADTIHVNGSVTTLTVGVVPVQSTGLSTVTGTVTETGGAPRSGVHILARSQGGRTVGYGLTDSEGDYSIVALASGPLTMSVGRFGYESKEEPLDVPAGASEVVDVDFALAKSGTVVSVRGEGLPVESALDQNYPNPFNPTTRIDYSVSGATQVVLKVYDLLGREVMTLVDERQISGSYSVNLDAKGLSSGVYLYRLEVGDFIQTKKMVLMR